MSGTDTLLIRLFNECHGACSYCDGTLWCATVEKADQARARLCIIKGKYGDGKRLERSRAVIDPTLRLPDGKRGRTFQLSCKFCRSRRGDVSTDEHRAEMQKLVAAGEHPVNRDPAQREARAA